MQPVHAALKMMEVNWFNVTRARLGIILAALVSTTRQSWATKTTFGTVKNVSLSTRRGAAGKQRHFKMYRQCPQLSKTTADAQNQFPHL
jgi:hypothetical protein